MPLVGEIRPGKEIGKRPGRWVWVQCPICLDERWTNYKITAPRFRWCSDCNLNSQKSNFKLPPKNKGGPV